IIVAHNNFEFNISALYSLRNTYKKEIQVIFVDSGSLDDTKEIENHVIGMNIIRYQGNVGFVIACNKAITMAISDTVLLLNNDVEILPQAIQNAYDRLYSQPFIGAVGGKIIKPNGTLQEAGCIFWRQGTTRGYKRDELPSIPEVNFVRNVDFCSGAFLLIRKEVINKIGLFDDNYIPAYYEESD
ncbi:glycosyltransferase, partial [Acetobacter pomorum]